MKIRVAVTAILTVLFIHVLGMVFEWYYAWRSMDIMMHFLGGFVFGMLGLALLRTEKLSSANRLLFVLGFVALIGVIWEFQEYAVDYYRLIATDKWESLTLTDTLADLMNDLVGGLIAYLIFIKK